MSGVEAARHLEVATRVSSGSSGEVNLARRDEGCWEKMGPLMHVLHRRPPPLNIGRRRTVVTDMFQHVGGLGRRWRGTDQLSVRPRHGPRRSSDET